MLLLSTKLQANMVSKYEELEEKQNQLEKLIHQISLMTKTNAILVQKFSIRGCDFRGGECQDN